MAGGEGASLEYTPTWVVALVCTVIVAISLAAERLLHYAGKFLINKKQGPLFDALLKIKEELMLLGFISLLLTVFQGRISTICIAKHLTDDWLPCKKETDKHDGGGDDGGKPTAHFQTTLFPSLLPHSRRLLAGAGPSDAPGHCQKQGKEPLLSLDALHDLHIFIFVLAVVHVVFSALTILFGSLKIRQWKQWEDSIQKKEHDPEVSEIVTFQNHYRDNPKFNFYKYMVRALETDFKKVVGIRLACIFLDSIRPFDMGTKLEHIITQLAAEVAQRHVAVPGELVVKPSDHHFWFSKPRLVLVLIHIILFQNSFEIAIFFWMLVMFQFDSCIMGHTRYIIPRLVIGVLVQFLCSYSTLPLYAIVAQMGSSFNRAIFEEHIQEKLTGWAQKAKRNNKGQRKAMGGAGSSQVGNKESPSPAAPQAKGLEIETASVSNDQK
ncbi:UNVERIFIED_CONTAM: MLO-like protein 1 [Sesamum latifolium]|uniref:MLO-like protein n=1 Tax=Sesamum latifolium TaxID=2727402 RepID=A0AAW2XG46_9LAMI